ncbi:hypothetical protein IGI04_037451 [Brassica rapa subsp. trilocularis]|uniref:Uncharacterized protein n=1 Tax=Brassica rapa subsp. trilocularis TaxID=1813537 RepID=A0ABQ7LHD9_BRACM|nr:hypothetical protein IGI04_037451 [Brassica rapa subsp. trilocularis]
MAMKPNGKSPVSSVNDHEVMFFKDISRGPHYNPVKISQKLKVIITRRDGAVHVLRQGFSVSGKPEMLRKVVSSWAVDGKCNSKPWVVVSKAMMQLYYCKLVT